MRVFLCVCELFCPYVCSRLFCFVFWCVSLSWCVCVCECKGVCVCVFVFFCLCVCECVLV